MRVLGIDLETRNKEELKKVGGYRYAENCEILLFAFAYDEDPVQVIDMANGEEIPRFVVSDVLDNPDVIKVAYNAQFERTVLSNYFRKKGMISGWLDARQWLCTMVLGMTLGLPAGLDALGKVFDLSEDKAKMEVGKKLIKQFCKPDRNGSFVLPSEAPEDWKTFIEYNRRDVETERTLRKMMWQYVPNQTERDLWALDQRINDRGVHIDRELAEKAIAIDTACREEVMEEARELTGLQNPSSNAQLKTWLQQEEGWPEPPASLTKTTIPELMETCKSEDSKKALALKLKLGKTSTKKYQTMLNTVCKDGNVHGLLQFYGASRTGRWAGRLVQTQNLPRCYLEDLDDARETVLLGDREIMEFLYEDIPGTLSQLIRTAFIASDGCRFIDADFSAIEARVIAWQAGEKWRQEAFAAGKDIYCASASQMFHVPVEKHGINGHLRQKGKVAELACIAEGQLVLTDVGLVPIEKVTTDMKVWDGDKWVSHEGVIYKGEKEVMSYDGLTATPDHLVYMQGQSRPVRFDYAASCGARLRETGNCRHDIRTGNHHFTRKTLGCKMEQLLCPDEMQLMRKHPMDESQKPENGKIERMPALLTAKTHPSVAGSSPDSGKATLRESEGQSVPRVWSTRHQIPFSINPVSGALDSEQRSKCVEGHGNGQDQHERRLCTWKHPLCPSRSESSEQTQKRCPILPSERMAVCTECRYADAFRGADTLRNYRESEARSKGEAQELEGHPKTARVYDIRNAGPRHRYTVSGKLVHNCGYGGSIGALKNMGADKMGLSDEELKSIVTKWREASPNIVKLWNDTENAAISAVRKPGKSFAFGVNCAFIREDDILFMQLPSGRRIAYYQPELEEGYYGPELAYMGVNQTTRQWTKLRTYGGKAVENLIQSIARDCLATAMLRLDEAGYPIVMHIHDEVVIDMPKGKGSLDEVVHIMSQPIPWADGLILNADGWEDRYFKKE